MNLDQLDQLFQSIWNKTEDLPKALEDWQKKVESYMETVAADAGSIEELEQKFEKWQETLERNRALLEDHQEALSKDLLDGQESYITKKQAKNFR